MGSLMACSISGDSVLPERASLPFCTVVSTMAACSPPITEMREFGHIYKNLNLHVLRIKFGFKKKSFLSTTY